MKESGKLISSAKRFGGIFRESAHPSLLHFDLMREVDLGVPVAQQDFADAKRSADLMNRSAGGIHLYADPMATYYEMHNGEDVAQDDDIKDALLAIDEAISKEEYPKLYATRGCLLALAGRFDEAKASVTGLSTANPPCATTTPCAS